MLRFSNKREFDRVFADRPNLFESRWLWGARLRDATENRGVYEGFCGLCDRPTRFLYSTETEEPVNLREELNCEHCELNSRTRLALGMAREASSEAGGSVYATEQATLAYRWLAERITGARGSEFFTDAQRPRLEQYLEALFERPEPLRFEDATRLSFATASIDVVVSSDVLEHVPNFRAALSEFARVTRPGGTLILTVPFLDSEAKSLLRARIGSGGEIEHLTEPEYHGDPVSPDGVLAFHSFGWDLLDAVRHAGFWSAQWCLPWNPAQAIFSGLWILHARR